ncbi:MAG: hypothetical protein JWO06_3991 [Bacteroidota bacterium]|nr:hypothetical protein [Bacteroidota bacterium]
MYSPYHNEDVNLCRLFEKLSPHFKNAEDELPSQREIWNAVLPKQKFTPLKFARLHSDLLKKLEDFVVVDNLKKNESRKLKGILAYYTEKKLGRHYPEAAKVARKKLEASQYRDGEYYLQLYRLEAHHNSFLELQNQRSTEKNLLQTIEALDAFYLINKLNYLAAILHYKKFLSLEAEVKMAAEILEHLKQNNYQHIPALGIQYRVVLSLIEPNDENHFYELNALLTKHYLLFPKPYARNLFAFAINFCIRRINFGDLKFVNELFAIYKQMLKAELLMDEEGMLSQFDYKNIVTVGLRVGDAKWTERFIQEYKSRIPKAERQNAYTFNLSKLYFYLGKFDKVLPLLQDVEYSDIFYQLDSKTTLIKTYYELGEYLPLMALKESFRILLRRKKLISEQGKSNYMNFMRFTMKLYRVDVKNQKKFNDLKNRITASTNVADKGWLLEKLAELST